jgi:phosphonopyruvate decarboxylase
MIEAGDFLKAAQARGIDFFTGVPCSFLTPLINGVISDPATRYVGAASEGEAVAIAAGAWLAGRGTAVMCQNSGLGNMVNPLTSLNWPFRIPTLLIVTWRGEPGSKDEPQHQVMGEITEDVIDIMRFAHARFPTEASDMAPALDAALAAMARERLPYALVMAKGSVAETALDEPPLPARPMGERIDLRRHGERPLRFHALERLLGLMPGDAAYIATTGYCGRELFTIADRPQHLYQVGSMGGCSAMGLGVALNTLKPVVVLDGDGAALMKLGNMATIGAQQPKNLIHVLLDNEAYVSTGGQATVSPGVDFAAIALACGYRHAAVVDDLDGLATALASNAEGPRLVHVKIGQGSIKGLGRPTIAPEDVALRFRDFLATGGAKP